MDLLIQKNVIRKEFVMRRLEKEELICINGGIAATTINYLSKLITTVFDIGRALGSAIRRIESDNVCSL